MIINGNALDELKKMNDKSVDLVVTSPPYNMRTRIRNGKYTTREKSEHFSKKYTHFDDALPIDDFYELHKEVLKELLRVSKVVCYNFQTVTGSKEAFFKIIGDFNKDIKDILIWDKGHGQPAMHERVTNSCYEFILILEDDKKCGRVIQNAVFERGKFDNILRVGRGKRISNIHGAIFPEKLVEVLIKGFSNKGDIVLDPFFGSGTTGFVCEKLDRKWIGIELIQEYCEVANDRIKKVKEQSDLLDFKKDKMSKCNNCGKDKDKHIFEYCSEKDYNYMTRNKFALAVDSVQNNQPREDKGAVVRG
jgi:DNA modification methylase